MCCPELEAHLLSPYCIDILSLESLVKQRNHFWDYLSHTSASELNLPDLYLQWKFVLKQYEEREAAVKIMALNSNYYLAGREGQVFRPGSSLLSVTEKFGHLLNSALAGAGGGKLKAGRDLLWKRGGHPTLLRNPQLFNLEHRLYGLLAPFSTDPTLRNRRDAGEITKVRPDRFAHWKEGVHPLYFHMEEESKYAFVEAVATLYWLGDSASSENQAVVESLEQIERKLDERLSCVEGKLLYQQQEEELSEAALLEGERRMDPMQRKYAFFNLAFW